LLSPLSFTHVGLLPPILSFCCTFGLSVGHILSLRTLFSRHVLGSFLLEYPAALDTSCMWLLDSEAAKVSTPSLVIKVPAGVHSL